jgi:hypothetical protein
MPLLASVAPISSNPELRCDEGLDLFSAANFKDRTAIATPRLHVELEEWAAQSLEGDKLLNVLSGEGDRGQVKRIAIRNIANVDRTNLQPFRQQSPPLPLCPIESGEIAEETNVVSVVASTH